jgi:hypothetical protein
MNDETLKRFELFLSECDKVTPITDVHVVFKMGSIVRLPVKNASEVSLPVKNASEVSLPVKNASEVSLPVKNANTTSTPYPADWPDQELQLAGEASLARDVCKAGESASKYILPAYSALLNAGYIQTPTPDELPDCEAVMIASTPNELPDCEAVMIAPTSITYNPLWIIYWIKHDHTNIVTAPSETIACDLAREFRRVDFLHPSIYGICIPDE